MSLGDRRRAKRKADHKRWDHRERTRRRELGQNFLKDKRVARLIVDESGVGKDDIVVEFGAGGGVLTRQLARKVRRVIAVECDPSWALHLRERFSDDENVRVVQGDALTMALPGEPFRVVANVPFYATTSILHRLLDDPTSPLDEAHLLVQRQVAFKHARASPTTLKTLTWSPWYRFYAGLVLPADAFHPKPKVDACLLRVARRDPPLVAPHHRHPFRALVRLAFDGRRNTVGKVLRPVFTRTQICRLARDNGFSPDFFPSMLDVHQWAGVFGFMIRAVPQDRWPLAGRQELQGESSR